MANISIFKIKERVVNELCKGIPLHPRPILREREQLIHPSEAVKRQSLQNAMGGYTATTYS